MKEWKDNYYLEVWLPKKERWRKVWPFNGVMAALSAKRALELDMPLKVRVVDKEGKEV